MKGKQGELVGGINEMVYVEGNWRAGLGRESTSENVGNFFFFLYRRCRK